MATTTIQEFDALDRHAIEAAKNFTDWYYRTISPDDSNDGPIRIAHAYTNASPSYQSLPLTADIVLGGVRFHQPSDVENALHIQRLFTPTTSPSPSQQQKGLTPATTPAARPAARPACFLARVHHEVESLDVQIANPDYRLGCSPDLLAKLDRERAVAVASRHTANTASSSHYYDIIPHPMLLVAVDGVITFGSGPSAPRKTFHERFVLVPNWEWLGRWGGGKAISKKQYLIAAQNFRRRG